MPVPVTVNEPLAVVLSVPPEIVAPPVRFTVLRLVARNWPLGPCVTAMPFICRTLVALVDSNRLLLVIGLVCRTSVPLETLALTVPLLVSAALI